MLMQNASSKEKIRHASQLERARMAGQIVQALRELPKVSTAISIERRNATLSGQTMRLGWSLPVFIVLQRSSRTLCWLSGLQDARLALLGLDRQAEAGAVLAAAVQPDGARARIVHCEVLGISA